MEEWRAGKGERIVSGVFPPEQRNTLTLNIIQHGRYLDVLGHDEELFPYENLKRVPRGELPPMWLFHGRDDTLVPVRDSEGFVEEARRLHPQGQMKLTVLAGEHGLDGQPGVGLDTPWVAEGVQWVEKYWLGNGEKL